MRAWHLVSLCAWGSPGPVAVLLHPPEQSTKAILSELNQVGEVAKKELELHFKKSPGGNRLRRFLSPESGTASDDAVTVVHIDDRPPSLAGASADGASSLAGGVGVLHLASLSSSRAQTISGQQGTGLSLALRPPQRSHPEVQAELEVLSNQILQPWKVVKKVGGGELGAAVGSEENGDQADSAEM
mmetsp:Transcript_46545/g.122926  ORF Transcript_46545/g.122926 Transcript_46545/m.122926 type:complete len:186 (+) Transcript_46545:28-585(+)